MASTSIREHLRAALEVIIVEEKQRLHDIYNESDAAMAGCIEMMQPLIESLKALDSEIGKVAGIEIDIAPAGHMATVKLESSVLEQTFSISTSIDNLSFEIEEQIYYSISDYDTLEKRHAYEKADQALALSVEAVGKQIAQQRVLQKRKD